MELSKLKQIQKAGLTQPFTTIKIFSMALFKNRTIRIERDTGINLTGATLLQIRYIKPDGLTKGSWTATADGTIVWYKTTTTDIDQWGIWKVQAYVEIGSDKYSGDYETFFFDKPIEV